MLYDPKWDVMSLEGLIAWLELQPPEGTYDWNHCENCLLGRYLMDRVGSIGLYRKYRNRYSEMPHYLLVAAAGTWTFGAALERARMAMAAGKNGCSALGPRLSARMAAQ